MEDGCVLLTQLTVLKWAEGSGKTFISLGGQQPCEMWLWFHTPRWLHDQI